LALDDFGTGYSSLSYLHRLPMSYLKIDQAFVRDMMTTSESMSIVKTIVLLAHALEMPVIAEGIETDDQLRALRDLGCEFGQGYLFSKPQDATTTAELIVSDPSW
jgi:EAL domain-containing protein (putative c-di-GMP-specific phosphodiesterase class I)